MRSVCVCACALESNRNDLVWIDSFRFVSVHLQMYVPKTAKWNNISFFLFIIYLHLFLGAIKLLHSLKTLSIADMGVIPYELLVPLGQLRALNLSGNHLVNVSMQILHPVDSLEVSWIIGNKMPFIIFISVNIFFWYQFFSQFPFFSAIGYFSEPVKWYWR